MFASVLVMMFNGLLMCDSDSDCAKESVGRWSVDSPASSSASARAHYYENKLLATLQVLSNSEATVRVQADSLALAERRIAELTARAHALHADLQAKGEELQALRLTLDGARTPKSDVSVTAHIEMVNQENIVNTLQSNLSVIEDLYRECFYETVKQDELIETLRKSYLDVRLMDKQKTDHITKLNKVINTQKWSLDTCQDMAAEVDSLKVEISNFLNSSSNDSGMWEGSAGAVEEDLTHIAAQLTTLMDMLTGDCTCGLQEENTRLRQRCADTEVELSQLRQRISELEGSLASRDSVDQQYKWEIDSKHAELQRIREQLVSVERASSEHNSSYELLAAKLNQTQSLLERTRAELAAAHSQRDSYHRTVKDLTRRLDTTQQVTKQNESLVSECGELRRELERQRALHEHMHQEHRRAVSRAASLQRSLAACGRRGAALCRECSRVTAHVSTWATTLKEHILELKAEIERKDSELRALRQNTHIHSNNSCCFHPALGTTSTPIRPTYTRTRGMDNTCALTDRRYTSTQDDTNMCSHTNDSNDRMKYTQDVTKIMRSRSLQRNDGSPTTNGRSRRRYIDETDTMCSHINDTNDRYTRDETEAMCSRSLQGNGSCSTQTNKKVRCNAVRAMEDGEMEAKYSHRNEGSYVRTGNEGSCVRIKNESVTSREGAVRSDTVESEGTTPPTPPKRLLRKNRLKNDNMWSGWWGVSTREEGSQRPVRSDASTAACRCDSRQHTPPRNTHRGMLTRGVSPDACLLERVASMAAALEDSCRRWARHDTHAHTTHSHDTTHSQHTRHSHDTLQSPHDTLPSITRDHGTIT